MFCFGYNVIENRGRIIRSVLMENERMLSKVLGFKGGGRHVDQCNRGNVICRSIRWKVLLFFKVQP